VRIALLHHITWSINSVCHVFGERPLKTRAGDWAARLATQRREPSHDRP
jgi:stearoyl-CoA desaturase (delta-9 desaturase)